MLNRSKGAGVGRGSDAEANKWMFKSAEYVLGRIKPKVMWGENAQMLFTKKGQGVVHGLRLVQVRLFSIVRWVMDILTQGYKINCIFIIK